ncbi:RICIN domain-containing protein [Pinirhizobacter soli]|uniref:RICIN domain-containing protein n=1 Tax=Pinirhizobacter soli TaxID=2786953 RepID=UPI00202ABB0D|nr:RICIN domain-containing protein [Pinirhizobacter soli]
MQLKSLPMAPAIAIAIALAGVGITPVEAVPLGAVDSSSGRHGASPTSLANPSSSEPIRFVPLRELATMLDKSAFLSNRGVEGVDAILRRGAQTRAIAPASSTDTAVVMASSLAQPDVIGQVYGLYKAGLPVAVIRSDDPSDVALTAHAFGAAMRAKVAIYFRGPDGKIDVVGAGGEGEVLTPAGMAERMATAIGIVTKNIDEVRKNSRTMAPMAEALDDAPLVPRIDMTMTMTGMVGSSIRGDVTVLRDSTVSRDSKRVISRVTYQANPKDGGFFDNRRALVIPDSYRLTQAIARSDDALTDVADIYPMSNGSTDITFSETKQSTTNYGFNISPEIERSLVQQVPNASAKAGFGFNFAKSYMDEKAVQLTVKDYYVATSSGTAEQRFSQTTWNLRLADNIRNNTRYFGSDFPVNNITPMMNQAAAQNYAIWNLPGAFEGMVTLRAQFDMEMRLFQPYANENRIVGTDPSTVKLDMEIDASSPYLTREPTVLIRSSVGAGSCLQTQFVGAGMALVECDASPTARAQQWTFDEQGRYRNRATNDCLQSDADTSNSLRMVACSLDQRQRFRWVADRIHNLFNNDDTGLRLVAGTGGAVGVSPGTQTLPPNVNHGLLVPWSSYPGAAEVGDTIPGFNNATPIPPDWVGRYQVIPNNERWDVIPLRAGL